MLQGKTALVTGSTSGIGLGIAQSLAAAGCDVMLNGFGDKAEINALVERLRTQYDRKIFYNAADMSRGDEVRALVADATEKLGKLDILVNNAGIQFTSPVDEFPEEKWDAIIAINLSANFHTTKAALPGMKANGWGRIINIASAHALVASKNKSAYVAAKHGVLGLTKVVALETAELDITCNAICPGWVKTPLVEKQIQDRAQKENKTIEQAQRELLSEKQPSMRFTEVDELGALAVFLCSDAARNITGSAYNMDGGWLAQ